MYVVEDGEATRVTELEREVDVRPSSWCCVRVRPSSVLDSGVGLLGAMSLTRLLQIILHRVSPIDPLASIRT
jgi:hypothetical protein